MSRRNNARTPLPLRVHASIHDAICAAHTARAEGEPELRVAFEVHMPFKCRGAVLKPPSWVELDADEAAEYQQAGVLGDVPSVIEDDLRSDAPPAPPANTAPTTNTDATGKLPAPAGAKDGDQGQDSTGG